MVPLLLSLLGLLKLSQHKALRRSLPQLRPLALAVVQRQLFLVDRRLGAEVVVLRKLLPAVPQLRPLALALGLALRQAASQTGASETLAPLTSRTAKAAILLRAHHLRTHVYSLARESMDPRYCGSRCSQTPWYHTWSSWVASRCRMSAAPRRSDCHSLARTVAR